MREHPMHEVTGGRRGLARSSYPLSAASRKCRLLFPLVTSRFHPHSRFSPHSCSSRSACAINLVRSFNRLHRACRYSGVATHVLHPDNATRTYVFRDKRTSKALARKLLNIVVSAVLRQMMPMSSSGGRNLGACTSRLRLKPLRRFRGTLESTELRLRDGVWCVK